MTTGNQAKRLSVSQCNWYSVLLTLVRVLLNERLLSGEEGHESVVPLRRAESTDESKGCIRNQ